MASEAGGAGRRWRWFGGGLVVFAGFGVWSWFLAGRTLETADRWSSVLSGFVALAGLVMSVLALARSRPAGAADPSDGRNVQVGGDASNAVIVTGDNSPVRRYGQGK